MQWSDRIGRRLKLRDLHILLAVAKAGSMGKAAAELSISQPSISKAIAEVEHALGCVCSTEARTASSRRSMAVPS
jgi:molybdenum-dependent DNA-binding transcriptional regulator ModE